MGIDLKDYAMGRDVLFPQDWAKAKDNAERLLKAVNKLLSDLFPGHTFTVSSGFRPPFINAATPGAARRSLHMTGLAVDIHDHDKFLLANLIPEAIPAQAAKLRELGLFMESRLDTPTWCHLDLGTRVDRPTRTFKAK